MTKVKNLQGERTGREKADLNLHKNFILRTFEKNHGNFKYKECCFKAKQMKVLFWRNEKKPFYTPFSGWYIFFKYEKDILFSN